MIKQSDKNEGSVWLYESVQRMKMTSTEELIYSFLIKMSFYEMKDICEDVIADKDGKIDWESIGNEFSETPIVPFWLYQTKKFQQYIEDVLSISRRSFYNAINTFKSNGLLNVVYAEEIYCRNTSCLELFKDEYRNENTINKDKYQGQCYVLNIDFTELRTSHYRYIYLVRPLLKSPKLLYFYSWMLDKYMYWKKQGRKFMTSADHLAKEYGVSMSAFKKMVIELKSLGFISKDYKKEWLIK